MRWRGIDSIRAGRYVREAPPWLTMKPRFKHRASGMLKRITQLAHAPHAPEEEYMGVQRMGAKDDYDLLRSELTRICSCGCAKRSAMRLPRRWIFRFNVVGDGTVGWVAERPARPRGDALRHAANRIAFTVER